MKYNVTVGEKTFEVEIDDINRRPVIARVNGQEFAVSPENGVQVAGNLPLPPADGQKPLAASAPVNGNPASNVLSAPLPGTVIEVFVEPGDEVETGQVILIIEAMKMKNSIRSVREGIVSAVLVSAGQTVTHKQALVEFAE